MASESATKLALKTYWWDKLKKKKKKKNEKDVSEQKKKTWRMIEKEIGDIK